jgi:spermidine synthase
MRRRRLVAVARVLARHGAFFGTGLLATAAQVLLLRELVVDVAGDEAAIGVGLAAWLAGIAMGAWAARRRRAAVAPQDAAAGLALLAVLPIGVIVAGRLMRQALAPGAGQLPGVGLALAVSLATLAPPGALVGWTFTALASAASRVWVAGEGIARLYVAESLGSIGGGLLVTVLAGRLAPLRTAALVGALAAAPAIAAGWDRLVAGRRLLAGALVAAAAALVVSGPLDRWSERARFAGTAPGVRLSAVLDTPYQHLALGGDEVTDVYASGQYAGSFPDPYSAESLGHLVACLAPDPRSVLVLGGTEQGLLPVLIRHPVRELLVVEPDAQAFTFLRARLPEADQRALRDPRVLVVHDDPRHFVSLARRGGAFDLVLLLGPDPATLLRARLTTAEFYRLLAARLRPDGVIVVGLRTAPNVITGETAALAGALLRSLQEALPVVRATPGPDSLLVAGWRASAVTLDPAVLAERWRARGLSSPSFDASLLPLLLPPERVAATEAALLAAGAGAVASRDDRPASFLHALARRQQVSSGVFGRALAAASRIPPGLLAVLALLPSLAVMARLLTAGAPPDRRAAAAASHAVAVAGAAGMGWSLLVLFSFQTHAGALYGQLGVLTALFMAGLAVGAALARRALVAAVGREGGAADPRLALRVCVGAALAFAAALPSTLTATGFASRAGVAAALIAHGALLLAAGVVTGSLFPVAAVVRLAAGDGAGEAAGRLETADHVGAAAAALLGAVLFVPILGLATSAGLLAALLAVALGATFLPGRG